MDANNTNTIIADWTPPEWVYNCFPLPAPDVEAVTLDYIVDAMQEEINACTEWDSTPLGRVLHVAHMLVCYQGEDGLWPAAFNLRTGRETTLIRSSAPHDLMNRLNDILASTEFDFAIRHCEAGIQAQQP